MEMLTASSPGMKSNINYQNNGNKEKVRPTKAEYDALKMKHPCNKCVKYGHWVQDHALDVSLPPFFKSVNNKASIFQTDNGLERKRTASLNMEALTGSAASTHKLVDKQLVSHVDDGASYSTIGFLDLKLLTNQLYIDPALKLDPIPSNFKVHYHCKYGIGDHSSPVQRILVSIILTATSDSVRNVEITYLVLEGSSQWVIG